MGVVDTIVRFPCINIRCGNIFFVSLHCNSILDDCCPLSNKSPTNPNNFSGLLANHKNPQQTIANRNKPQRTNNKQQQTTTNRNRTHLVTEKAQLITRYFKDGFIGP